jgi:catechol 2,3-dioxygenase-like lactoylglutathione lyase family enzyme
MNLNHLDLPVADIAAARDFFTAQFGFRSIFEREDGLTVLLDDADFALTLSPLPASERIHYPTGFHVGFMLDAEEELLDAHQRLSDAGVEIVRPLGLLGGALTFHCLAPGPLLLELSWRRRD